MLEKERSGKSSRKRVIGRELSEKNGRKEKSEKSGRKGVLGKEYSKRVVEEE